MDTNRKPFRYRLVYSVLHFFYPKTEILGLDRLPEGAAVVVGNHSQAHGPLISQFYFPAPKKIWCAGQMMHREEIPAYAYQDFWANKPRLSRPMYKLIAHCIAPLAECIFQNADTIGVYRDGRALSTFKTSVKALKKGEKLIIFPETYEGYNQILCDFQRNFIDIAKLYIRQGGTSLPFVPAYYCPALHKVYLGQPILFDPTADIAQERERITKYLMESITELAMALPEHTVVPYPNLPKKKYGTNLSKEAIIPHENPGR